MQEHFSVASAYTYLNVTPKKLKKYTKIIFKCRKKMSNQLVINLHFSSVSIGIGFTAFLCEMQHALIFHALICRVPRSFTFVEQINGMVFIQWQRWTEIS